MTNDPLTNEEIAALASAGWRIGGGGLYDGKIKVRGERRDSSGLSVTLRTRAEWRAVIAGLPRVSLPDDLDALQKQLEETQARYATATKNNLRLQVQVAQQLSLLGHVLTQIEMDEDSASYTSAAGQTLRAYFNGLAPDPLDITLEVQSDA
jgi:hypothetical protein